jgi:hypothetical protein
MRKLTKYAVLALVLALGSSTYARAETVSVAYNGTLDEVITFLFGWLIGNNGNTHHDGKPGTPTNPEPPKPTVAPEIDPNSAFGALVLMGGMLTVIRSRRKK